MPRLPDPSAIRAAILAPAIAPAIALALLAPAGLRAEGSDPAPAAAQDPAAMAMWPGAVTQFMAAQDLFALGRDRKDALAVLAAARLAATIQPQDTDRIPLEKAETVPPSYPDAATMFLVAKALAQADDPLSDLVARSMAESVSLPARTLVRSSHGIAAGATLTFALPAFGHALTEVAVLGDGRANLDLTVADPQGAVLCTDQGPGDRALCALAPAQNETLTLTVTNRDSAAASFSLLSN